MISDLEEKEVCALCTKKPDFLTERSFRVNGLSGCGHKFCSSCIDHQFRTKDYFRCPKCQKSVRREQVLLLLFLLSKNVFVLLNRWNAHNLNTFSLPTRISKK